MLIRTRKPVESLLSLEGGSSFKTRARSFLDGISFLESRGWPKDQVGRVRVCTINLPSGDFAYLVVILTGASGDLSISLPTCSAVRATETYRNQRTYCPSDFDEATVDHEGNVTLADDTHLHACEVVPTKLPIDWESETDRIVRQAVAFLGAEDKCYFDVAYDPITGWAGYLNPFKVAPKAELIGNSHRIGRFLDYRELASLEMERHKFEAFVAFHQKNTPLKRRRSRQTLANILRNAGLRIPLSAARPPRPQASISSQSN